MYSFIEQFSYPEKEFMEMFNLDVIPADIAFLKSDKDWKKFILNDGSKCLIPNYLNIEINKERDIILKDNNNFILGKKPKTSLYVNQTYWVWKDLPNIPDNYSIEDLNKHIWSIPVPPWYLNIFNEKDYRIFINSIKELNKTNDYAITLLVGCGLFEPATFLRGFDNFLCDMYLDKKGVKKLFDVFVENHICFLEKVLNGVKDYIDVLVLSDDLGGQGGPFMSPDIFNELYKPRYKKIYDFIHENSKCKIFLHCCGSIMELIPGLIDAGLDIINPVQTNAFNMDPYKLKKEFGKYLTFWGGGCDTRNVLPNKSIKEIRGDVKRRIAILNKDGGFVFAAIHNVLADVPPDNIITMLEAAYEFGFYN